MSKKQKVSEKEVEKIASLSRLSLSQEELVRHTEDMNNILDHMDLLNEVDTENVDELVNVHDMASLLRDDTFEDSLDKDSVIENSPESSKDYIEVPLVLKKESQ
ncbi:MAG: Asp-tRNA(Asn)/Glu-tRNA(Gln) amidotransferase subunit GatC [Candidatus Marinimicrobia bacterium]|nr:Asp-tRNA(Asn)/Glu-tRNA(Gln) amidotransferase subunit GatC [Candidatus Neomarinimicrobiota bacterium]